MQDVDPDRLVKFAEEHVERAVESTDAANPTVDVESIEDLYGFVLGVDPDDLETHTLEIELHDFELLQLISSMMDGIERPQNADEMAFKSNMIAKLVAACPEHLQQMDLLSEEVADSRGFE